MKTLVPMIFSFVLFGCAEEMTARVQDGSEVAPGARVTLAGVQVGVVKSVEVVGGDAPIAVTFEVQGDNGDAIAAGACARAADGEVQLRAGTDQAVVDGAVPACPADVFDTLGDVLEGAARTVNMSAGELSREAARRAAEQLRGAAEGFREGLGPDGVREAGRALGMAAVEFEEGVEQGVTEAQ